MVAGDSAYWVQNDGRGIKVRGSPLVLARVDGRFQELYVVDDDRSFENALFAAKGARPPTREDWASFAEDRYRGWWVQVDPRTRRVTDYSDRPILTFPRPTADRGLRLQALRPRAPRRSRPARPPARTLRAEPHVSSARTRAVGDRRSRPHH